jgi:hypothetical protein
MTCEAPFAQCIDLRAVEPGAEQRELVRRDEDSMRIGADVRIVAEAKAEIAVVIGRALRAVVLHRQRIDGPRSGRIGGVAHGEIKVVRAGERRGRADAIERQHEVKPALRVGIEETRRIGDVGPTCAGRAIDRRGVTIERILVDRSHPGIAGRVVDPDDVVHRLHHEAIARAQTLIGRLDRKLVAAIREALLVEIEAVEAPHDSGIR